MLLLLLFICSFVRLFVCLFVCLVEQSVGIIQLTAFRNHIHQAIVYVRRNIFVEYIVKIKLVNVPPKFLLNRLPLHTCYFSFQPVLLKKGRSMCYPACGIVHIKYPLLLIEKSSPCYTSRGALAGTRNSSMGPPHEGSIRRPIAP